ncbi:hypothetical protein JCM19000A_13230 [Silvimonas sp. JCM 19000]
MSQPLRFVLLQLAAVLLAFWLLPRAGLLNQAVTAALLAAIAARVVHDRRWWMLIHAVFPLAVVGALTLNVPSWVWLVAFVLMFVVYSGAVRSRVPLYLSNPHALGKLSEHIPPHARLLDIGAGTGTVLAWLHRQRPDVQLSGIELAWLPWLIGRARLGKAATWLRGDAMALNLGGYDVIYAYLSPEPMAALWLKLQQEWQPGSRLISNSFAIPGVPPDEIVEVEDWKNSRLYIWHHR